MQNRNWKEWFKAAGLRAFRTFAQVLAASLTGALVLSDVDWVTALSTAAMACLYSFIMSLGGLPELKCEEEFKMEEDCDEFDDEEFFEEFEEDEEKPKEGYNFENYI